MVDSKHQWKAWLYLSPAIVLLLIFTVWPIINTVSIVSENAASQNPVIRSIINADNKVDVTAENVKYALKAHKVFIFNKETEERIYF